MFFEMSTLNLKDVAFCQLQVIKLVTINFFSDWSAIDQPSNFEVHDKVFKGAYNVFHWDVCSINYTAFITSEGIGFLDLVRSKYSWVIVRTLMDGMRHTQVGTWLDWCTTGSVTGIWTRLTHQLIFVWTERTVINAD